MGYEGREWDTIGREWRCDRDAFFEEGIFQGSMECVVVWERVGVRRSVWEFVGVPGDACVCLCVPVCFFFLCFCFC